MLGLGWVLTVYALRVVVVWWFWWLGTGEGGNGVVGFSRSKGLRLQSC